MKPTPHQIAARLTEELRTLYRDHNDGPRLIAEIVASEFPESAKLILGLTNYEDMERENERLRERVEYLEDNMPDDDDEDD